MNKRTFIAIKIFPNEKLLSAINEIKNELNREKIKWVETENVHLTLKFLGETKAEEIQKVRSLLKKISKNLRSFEFRLLGSGVFKSFSHPNVLWIGIEAVEDLISLHHQISGELENSGFQMDDEKFSPHLTIARIKELQNIKLLKDLVEKYKTEVFQLVNVSELIYFESILTPKGPIYKPIEKFSFENPKN